MSDIWTAAAWIAAAAILGFGVSAFFAARLELHRRLFLIPYILLASAFLYVFVRNREIDLSSLLGHNVVWGIATGLIVGGFLVLNVRSQPPTRETSGGELLVDLLWSGVTYGIIDALLLNVMPVVTVLAGLSRYGWGSSWLGTLGLGLLALLASMLVTFSYHIGYKEFRDESMGMVLIGNVIITLAYLVSGNPLGAIISHSGMHLAAVIQGPETTLQLPPHQHKPADMKWS